jgi:hypothetical protein
MPAPRFVERIFERILVRWIRRTHVPNFSQLASETKLSGAVRVTLPISVAYDLEKFQIALGNIARRAGHPTCTSGVDLTFLTSREWVVNPSTLEAGESFSENGVESR